ncbi:MAG: hypothetical protein IJ776_09245 [Paludibacteraceae bacterium]|nr:hypothetical protein [Paludibacteraceae bacterium]
MKECFVLFDVEQHKFYSESESLWSVRIGTFYRTKEDARAAMQRNGLDSSKVGTIHLFDF